MPSSQKILLLDGGMGTTLETLGADVSSALWGSELVVTDPAAIARVHRAFVEAGADIIETATYQMSAATFAAAGQAEAAAPTMQAAVSLALSAAGPAAVALSLGPYGAALRPGQEYAGIYDAPYGPGPSPAGERTNAFPATPAGQRDAAAAEGALAAFHLARLRACAACADWARVSYVAFETVPVLHEVRGARRAMAALAAEGGAKPFWITSAFPGGEHGQRSSSPGGARAPVEAVVAAMLDGEGARPSFIGVNCTNPGYLGIVDEFTAAAARRGGRDVGLVVYPDGGEVYDVEARRWSGVKMAPQEWAARVAAVAHRARAAEVDGEPVWRAVIVGGCCKAGPDEIAALRRAIDHA